jgi:hypothetical protein
LTAFDPLADNAQDLNLSANSPVSVSVKPFDSA